MPTTQLLEATPEAVETAAGLLREGQLVAIPTETVYGLAADAGSDDAVARIYSAKGRPAFNPLIAHVANLDMAQRYAVFPNAAITLAQAFWPGPLTLVLPIRDGAPLSPLTTAGLATVGIRVPDHPLSQQVLRHFGGALAAPSANPSGRISPTTPDHVLDGLNGRIAAVIDGGSCGVGVESTIVAVDEENRLRLLRPGGISADDIFQTTGLTPVANASDAGIEAPGQMTSHYAPRGTMRLNADTCEPGEVLLGFGDVECTLNLSRSANLAEAAANLFRMMHRLDADGATRIAVSPIPESGIGIAINDRLKRAAAPRD